MKRLKDFIKEDGVVGSAGPTNVVGTGAIAGTGQGPDKKAAEPPMRKRLNMFRRKKPSGV